MTGVLIRGGATVDIPTAAENAAAMHDVLAAARGYKWMRLPTYLQGKPSGSAITLGVTKGQPPVGPAQGFAWVIRRLIVTGLTTGATPDVVNLFLNDNFAGPIQWQFNGNNFGYTFNRSEMVLAPSDTLALQNSGNIVATGLITLSGELEEVPAEMLYKLR